MTEPQPASTPEHLKERLIGFAWGFGLAVFLVLLGAINVEI